MNFNDGDFLHHTVNLLEGVINSLKIDFKPNNKHPYLSTKSALSDTIAALSM